MVQFVSIRHTINPQRDNNLSKREKQCEPREALSLLKYFRGAACFAGAEKESKVLLFFSLQMTIPEWVQGLQEADIESELNDERIMETMRS